MPYAPKRPCVRPGCAELVDRGYCPAHAHSKDETRGSATERGYTWKWRVARLEFIKRQFAAGNCFCADCNKPFFNPSDIEVHHSIKHSGNQTLFWNKNLWVCLCSPCHSKRTARGE